MTKIDELNIPHSEEPNLEKEKNIEPVALPAMNELQAIENQLENSSIPIDNTQPDNKKVVELVEEATLEKAEEIPQPDTPDLIKNTPEIVPEQVVEIQQQGQSEKPEIIQVVVTEEPVPQQETPETVEEIPPQDPESVKNEVVQIHEPQPKPAIGQETTQAQQPVKVEITTTLVITATPEKKKPKPGKVETVLTRTKVPRSDKFKNWQSRSDKLPQGKPYTVYHDDETATTIITAQGYHEAPGFKTADINKLRNESEEDIKHLVNESFRCQLGFIKAYFKNLREHPELPW